MDKNFFGLRLIKFWNSCCQVGHQTNLHCACWLRQFVDRRHVFRDLLGGENLFLGSGVRKVMFLEKIANISHKYPKMVNKIGTYLLSLDCIRLAILTVTNVFAVFQANLLNEHWILAIIKAKFGRPDMEAENSVWVIRVPLVLFKVMLCRIFTSGGRRRRSRRNKTTGISSVEHMN